MQLRPGMQAFDYQFTADRMRSWSSGTFCHENGHMLCDYPDLYDYGDESSGVGGFCLMCAGNNVNEKNPIPISAYLKRLSGWAHNVTPLEHDHRSRWKPARNDFAIYSRGGREYFLLENRQRAGRDASLPDEGSGDLARGRRRRQQPRADDRAPATTSSRSNRPTDCSSSSASGTRWAIAGDLFAGARARFADDTTPDSKWWNGTSSNLTIDQISAAGASITFRCLLCETRRHRRRR